MKQNYIRFERILISIISILAAGVLVFLALQGPLFLDSIRFKTSASAIYQTMGQDLINLVVMVPILLLGGFLTLIDQSSGKYLLILTPIYLLYMALSYGIGMEWSDDRYVGNSQNYFFLYLFLIITGLLLIFYTISRFSPEDAPQYSTKQIRIYVTLMAIFLFIFTKIWMDEVIMVIQTGDTLEGSYSSAPTVFWVVRYFDLGITIPLGFIGLYLMTTRMEQAYPVILMFFGFFVTMILAVNAMGWFMWYFNDPELQLVLLPLFGILAILSFSGYSFLIKDKLRGVFS